MVNRHPVTPDGRYFVVRGRLWRCTNPNLPEADRTRLVKDLMNARRDVKKYKEDASELQDAHRRVQVAKEGLGERGAVWWDDDAPDFNQKMARNTPYAAWFENLTGADSNPR
jgi:hypothetical protein